MESAPVVLSQQGILDASKTQDWEALWVILITHTIKRLKYRYGIKEKPADLQMRAREHLSRVMDTVLVKGDRHWNTERYTTFQDFIISVIDSELSNAFQKKPSPEKPTETLPDGKQSNTAESEITYEELKSKVYGMLETDGASDEEILVFDCMADGILKPAHIREELGIDEKTFRRIWGKLQTRLEKINHYLWNNG